MLSECIFLVILWLGNSIGNAAVNFSHLLAASSICSLLAFGIFQRKIDFIYTFYSGWESQLVYLIIKVFKTGWRSFAVIAKGGHCGR